MGKHAWCLTTARSAVISIIIMTPVITIGHGFSTLVGVVIIISIIGISITVLSLPLPGKITPGLEYLL